MKDSGVTIFSRDSEEVRRGKREENRRAMQKDHQRGALLLPTGIPGNCKVEQPRAQMEYILTPTYKQGDTQYTNGEVRNMYFDGRENKRYAWGFAGRARITRESVTE